MNVLFCFQSVAQSRHFLDLMRLMHARGDRIGIMAATAMPGMRPPPYLAGLEGVRFHAWPASVEPFWARHADAFRMARSAAFLADDRFREAHEIRARVLRAVDPLLRPLASGAPFGRAALAAVERAIPARPDVMRALGETGPDVVLVSPLVNHLTGAQADIVKAARMLGIPVALPAFSWDNFSSKGALHECPDRIFVWNETQTTELIDLHGVDRGLISAHGAWRFDSYRRRRPSLDLEAYCAAYGFDPDKPILLYLGSSPLIAPREGRFAARWIAAVRGAEDPRVAQANILLRPHPRNLEAWRSLPAGAPGERVAFQAEQRLNLSDEQEIFDTIHHADACFAVNTSAVLEAALQGKPVLTVLDPDLSGGQGGTLHFAYLTEVGGGLLYQDRDLSAHIATLAGCLRRPRGAPDPRSQSFARAFLDRPDGGADCSASLLAAVDAVAAQRLRPPRRRLRDGALDAVLRGLVGLGLLPVTPVVNPQIHSTPTGPGGRTEPARVWRPGTLAPWRGVWRRRFRGMRAGLIDLLEHGRKPSLEEALFAQALHARFAGSRQGRALDALHGMASKRLASVEPDRLAGAERRARAALRRLDTPGGRKYVMEELLTDLDQRHAWSRHRVKRARAAQQE